MGGRIRTENGPRRKLDAELDEALAGTFPASDPVSVGHCTGTEPPSRPVERGAPEPTPPRRRQRQRKSAGRS